MKPLVIARGLMTDRRLSSTDIDLKGGEVVALVGPNGSGKTSLLHAMAAVPPSSGSVEVTGRLLSEQSPIRRQQLVGLLTADRHVAWPILGRDLIRLAAAAPVAFEDAIDQLELGSLLDRRVDRLSSGERARLLLARLLASDPRLLLLDEPLANLDPYWQLRVMELLRDRTKNAERALVLAIHDLASAVRFADRLLLMSTGSVAWDGPAAELQQSGEADRVFGAEWNGSEWELTRSADQQSSR